MPLKKNQQRLYRNVGIGNTVQESHDLKRFIAIVAPSELPYYISTISVSETVTVLLR